MELYQPDGIPVVFDLQIEAEVLGCNLKWEKTNPPAAIDHILDKTPTRYLDMPDLNTKKIPLVMESAKQLCAMNLAVLI